MPNSELLLKDSAQAIRILAPAASAFFEGNARSITDAPGPPSASAFPGSVTTGSVMPTVTPDGSFPSMPVDHPAVPTTMGHPATLSTTEDPTPLAAAGNPSTEQKARDQARSILRQIRITLNRYVSNRWEALIHTRNLLLATIAIAGVVLYLLVALAAVTHVPPSALVAGMVFYTVGAVSGLFGWLYRGSRIDSTVDDYGLMPARLIATPLLSGLGGLGGVIITAVLYSAILRPDGGGHANPQNFTASLEPIFTLYPPLILAAALFGLFPSLIIGTLLKQSHLYVEDLKAVQPSDEGTY